MIYPSCMAEEVVKMDEATYKAFWVGYGLRYAIGAAVVLLLAAVLHAVTTVTLSRLWPPHCSKCEGARD